MRYVRGITVVLFIVTWLAWAGSGFIAHKNQDNEKPVITSQADTIQVSVTDGEDILKQGLTASDNKDGDITGNILIGKQSKFVNKGTTQMEYLVFDSSNNVGEYTRTVEYIDYESPVFQLTQPLIYEKGTEVTILDRLNAVDSIQGNIDDKVKIVSSNVDPSKTGVYSMGIEVSNRFGDMVSANLPINIMEVSEDDVRITLNAYMITLKTGESFDPMSYIQSVEFSDGGTAPVENIQLSSNVDTAVPGTYQVIYEYQDESGTVGHTSLTVDVRE